MSNFSSSERWDKTKKYRQDHPRAFRTALLLNAHLYRVQIDNPKLQEGLYICNYRIYMWL